MAPPPRPTNVDRSDPGNEALIVNWTGIDTSVTIDLLGYQVLCDRGGALQVFKNGTFGAGFRTCATTPLPAGSTPTSWAWIRDFACSPLLTPTTNSFRVKILQNDITYGVSVVAIDNSYNASAPDRATTRTPVKTLSFYDVYRNGDETNTMPGAQPEPGRARAACARSPATPAAPRAPPVSRAIALAIGAGVRAAAGGGRDREPAAADRRRRRAGRRAGAGPERARAVLDDRRLRRGDQSRSRGHTTTRRSTSRCS